VTRHLQIAALLTLAAASIALASPAARPALIGVAISAATGFASLVAFGLTGRKPGKPMQKALAVLVVMFLVRLVLVAVGVVAVHRLGDSLVAFVVAFFVPYFAFAAIEGSLVHALGRQTGRTA